MELIDNTNLVMEQLKNAVRNALKEIGIVSVAEIQSNTPVDTGILRRSYTFVTKDFECIVGTDIDYSIYVELKPINRGGRPHFRKSLESLVGEFNSILSKHLRSAFK